MGPKCSKILLFFNFKECNSYIRISKKCDVIRKNGLHIRNQQRKIHVLIRTMQTTLSPQARVIVVSSILHMHAYVA